MMAAGVGRIPEDRHHDGVVGAMSVAENLAIETLSDPAVSRRGLLRRAAIRDRAAALIRDHGPFDAIFLDADKDGYIDYYEAVLPRLGAHGLIAADNSLLSGSVLDGEGPIARFNEHVAADPHAYAAAIGKGAGYFSRHRSDLPRRARC